MKAARTILLIFGIANLVAAVTIYVWVDGSPAFGERAAYSRFRNLVFSNVINPSNLKDVSGGPYSDLDDWWDQAVLPSFQGMEATAIWVAMVPLVNAMLCFYIWFVIGREMKVIRTTALRNDAPGVANRSG